MGSNKNNLEYFKNEYFFIGGELNVQREIRQI
jgi:hypothetical protein